jgi:hypothetical protein
VSNPGVAVTSFLQSDISSGQVRFVHSGSGTVPAYDINVSDGALSDGPSPASITFIPVVTPPPTPVGDPIDPPGPPSPPDPTSDPDLGEDPEPEPEPEPEEDPVAETEEEMETEATTDAQAEEPSVLAPEPTFESEPRDGNNGGDSGAGGRMNLQSILRAIAVGPTELKKILGLNAASDWAGNSFSFPLSLIEADGFVNELDELREDVSKAALLDKTMVASTVAVSSGLSVGYVVWLIRGGVLMSTVLSSLPAWRLIDPLPVLAYMGRDDEEDEQTDQEESLESIIEGGEPRADASSDDETYDPKWSTCSQQRVILHSLHLRVT